MKHTTAVFTTCALITGVAIALAGVAQASSTVRGAARVDARAEARADAHPDLERKKEQLTQRAASVNDAARAHADLRLTRIAARVDATRDRGERIAERIAKEFGVYTYIVMDQNLTLGATWGELVIAHTLASGTRGQITVEELMQLRKGGMGWGRMAAGLGYDLHSAVKVAETEASVARGRLAVDGKVATIRPGSEPADAHAVGAGASSPMGARAAATNDGDRIGK